MTLSAQQIIAILLFIVYAIITFAYYYARIPISIYMCIINILLLMAFVVLLFTMGRENFFFQVSPERERCLIEQVAPVRKRSCGCCNVGYVGGNLPVYQDWITPGDAGSWKRTDNLTMNKNDPVLTSQIPPTEYVKPSKRRLNRSQVEMYTQQDMNKM